jgi:manganese transport protein
LKGIFGDLAPTLFAVALIAAGQSSTITGTLAGQIVMEGYLNLRISPWIRRLITRLIAVAPAVFTIAYFGEEKIGDLLIFSQVILSLQLGFAVIPLIHFTSSKKLMGHFVNKKWVVVLAWISALIIIGLNVKLVGEELSNFLVSDYAQLHWLKLIVFIVVLYIAFLLVFVSVSPFLNKMRDKRMIPHTPIKPLALTRADAYQRIGIAVDFSSMDEASIQHALSAGNKEAHYFLFHIVESAAAMRHGENVMDIETKQDFAWITAYTNDLRLAGYTVSFEMEYGNRAANIAALAIRNNIELLVMGAHGHAGLKDILFGSTVEAVRHKLNIPILVVR